jgi:RNA-directed DNA polymerase
VRYADDFVIFTETKEDAVNVLPIVSNWLQKRGLELSEEKTKIVSLKEGFDFLGFTIRHQLCKRNQQGYHFVITPSNDSVNKLRRNMKEEWKRLNGSNADVVIRRMNPIIRGWANYFRIASAIDTFSDLDNWMFRRQVRFAKRTHSRKSATWTAKKYFGKLNLDRNDNWVFGNKTNGCHVQKFSWFKIKKHILVKGTNSPDDPALKDYWKKRYQKDVQDLPPSKQVLAKRQKHICPVCKQSLFNGEELHIHHHERQKKGGTSKYVNLRLLHMFCHKQVHSNMVVSNSLEPCAVRSRMHGS